MLHQRVEKFDDLRHAIDCAAKAVANNTRPLCKGCGAVDAHGQPTSCQQGCPISYAVARDTSAAGSPVGERQGRQPARRLLKKKLIKKKVARRAPLNSEWEGERIEGPNGYEIEDIEGYMRDRASGFRGDEPDAPPAPKSKPRAQDEISAPEPEDSEAEATTATAAARPAQRQEGSRKANPNEAWPGWYACVNACKPVPFYAGFGRQSGPPCPDCGSRSRQATRGERKE
jgi:hypothetical protein